MLRCWPEAASAPTGFAAGSYLGVSQVVGSLASILVSELLLFLFAGVLEELV